MFRQRNIGNIVIDTVNIVLVVPKFAFEGPDAIVSAGYSVKSSGGEIFYNIIQKWYVKAEIRWVTRNIIQKMIHIIFMKN